MNRIGNSSRLILALALAFAFVSCGGKQREILGKWSNEKEGVNVEFFSDNTFFFETGSERYAGDWIILDDGRLKMKSNESPWKIIVGELSFEDQKMKLGEPPKTATFTREK